MIVHHDEIKARPPRTWFQSTFEKLASKGAWPGLRPFGGARAWGEGR